MEKRAPWTVIGVIVVAAAAWMPIVAQGSDAPEHAFIGADKCKMCHNSAKKGAQYTKWKEAKHSKRCHLARLDKTKEPPLAQCLRCHTPGDAQERSTTLREAAHLLTQR